MTDAGIDLRRVLVVGVVASLTIAAAGVVAYAYLGDVPRGTHVLGVDIGGKTRTDAERTLHDAFDARAAEPVDVDLNGAEMSISPPEIAMTLEVDLTVGKAIRSGSPLLFGERTSPPVISLDRAKLAALLSQPAAENRKQPRGEDWPADPASASSAVKNAWLTGRTATIAPSPPGSR